MAMKRRSGRTANKKGQGILAIVCLSFLIGILGGAISANLMGERLQEESISFLLVAAIGAEEADFFQTFLKYMKYGILIWMGGWMRMGLFLSGTVFLFRGVSLGFTSAMLYMAFGRESFLQVARICLPQNLVLIPVYIFVMWAAVYYMLSWDDGSGRKNLKRERRRRQTEYCILFCMSIFLTFVGTGIETFFCGL